MLRRVNRAHKPIITTTFQQPLPKRCFGVNLAEAFTLFWLIPAVSKVVEELHQKRDFKKQLRQESQSFLFKGLLLHERTANRILGPFHGPPKLCSISSKGRNHHNSMQNPSQCVHQLYPFKSVENHN